MPMTLARGMRQRLSGSWGSREMARVDRLALYRELRAEMALATSQDDLDAFQDVLGDLWYYLTSEERRELELDGARRDTKAPKTR
jgi:hypothetical protein